MSTKPMAPEGENEVRNERTPHPPPEKKKEKEEKKEETKASIYRSLSRSIILTPHANDLSIVELEALNWGDMKYPGYMFLASCKYVGVSRLYCIKIPEYVLFHFSRFPAELADWDIGLGLFWAQQYASAYYYLTQPAQEKILCFDDEHYENCVLFLDSIFESIFPRADPSFSTRRWQRDLAIRFSKSKKLLLS